MLKTPFPFFFLFLLLIAQTSFSQDKDTILFLNGNVVVTTVVDTANGAVSFKNPKNLGKNFVSENDRIFSIKNPNGEFIIYKYDSIVGDEFTVDEMRYFIRGEQDAQNGFKPRGAILTNLLLGAGAGVTGSFLSPLAPFAFTALVGLPKIKIKKKGVSNLEYLSHDAYLMGYERVARKKRKLKTLISGGLGLGVGLGTYFILKANDAEIY